jgi:hypothetical protein
VALELRPITRDAAFRYIHLNHRHNEKPEGWLWGVAVHVDDELVGVGTASRPTAPALQDGRTLEITRVCTPDVMAHPHTCSRIYGALCRAAAALGYRRVFTYTLAEEDAASVRAAGFVHDGDVPARANLNTGNRSRAQQPLFETERRPRGEKIRWIRRL